MRTARLVAMSGRGWCLPKEVYTPPPPVNRMTGVKHNHRKLRLRAVIKINYNEYLHPASFCELRCSFQRGPFYFVHWDWQLKCTHLNCLDHLHTVASKLEEPIYPGMSVLLLLLYFPLFLSFWSSNLRTKVLNAPWYVSFEELCRQIVRWNLRWVQWLSIMEDGHFFHSCLNT